MKNRLAFWVAATPYLSTGIPLLAAVLWSLSLYKLLYCDDRYNLFWMCACWAVAFVYWLVAHPAICRWPVLAVLNPERIPEKRLRKALAILDIPGLLHQLALSGEIDTQEVKDAMRSSRLLLQKKRA